MEPSYDAQLVTGKRPSHKPVPGPLSRWCLACAGVGYLVPILLITIYHRGFEWIVFSPYAPYLMVFLSVLAIAFGRTSEVKKEDGPRSAQYRHLGVSLS